MKTPHYDVRMTLEELEALSAAMPPAREHYKTPLGDAIKKVASGLAQARAKVVGWHHVPNPERLRELAADPSVKDAGRSMDLAAAGMKIVNPALTGAPVGVDRLVGGLGKVGK